LVERRSSPTRSGSCTGSRTEPARPRRLDDKLRALERAGRAPRDDRNGTRRSRSALAPRPRPARVGVPSRRRDARLPRRPTTTRSTTLVHTEPSAGSRSSSRLYHGCGLSCCTDLIGNGVAPRAITTYTSGIRRCVGVWVPMYLMMLDGGRDSSNGSKGDRWRSSICRRASTSAARSGVVFAYEMPTTSVARSAAPTYYGVQRLPHSDGHRRSARDYAGTGRIRDATRGRRPALFGENIALLLGR